MSDSHTDRSKGNEVPAAKPASGRRRSGLSSRSSVESATIAQKAGLRQLVIADEPTIVIMPLDNTSHSSFCLSFYMKYIHKPNNKIHVCYVAEDFLRKHANESMVGREKNVKQKTKGCMAYLRQLLGPKRTILESMGPSPGMLLELERQDRANSANVRSEVMDVFSSNNVQSWDFKRITGEDPWTAILNYREERKGTLIVLGSRGLGKIQRNIFSSVSDKVLHKSPVPVLVVKRPVGPTTVLARGVSVID